MLVLTCVYTFLCEYISFLFLLDIYLEIELLGLLKKIFFFLFQFPNEEDSFHKFVAPEEVLPFTEGKSVCACVCLEFEFGGQWDLMLPGRAFYHTCCRDCSLQH